MSLVLLYDSSFIISYETFATFKCLAWSKEYEELHVSGSEHDTEKKDRIQKNTKNFSLKLVSNQLQLTFAMYYICQRKIGSLRVNTQVILTFELTLTWLKREKKFRVLITHLCLNILIRFCIALFLAFQINIYIKCRYINLYDIIKYLYIIIYDIIKYKTYLNKCFKNILFNFSWW